MVKENFGVETVIEMTGEEIIEALNLMNHQPEINDAEILGIFEAAQRCF